VHRQDIEEVRQDKRSIADLRREGDMSDELNQHIDKLIASKMVAKENEAQAIVCRLKEWRDEDALRPKSWITSMIDYCLHGEKDED
jgi:hypothetical protein